MSQVCELGLYMWWAKRGQVAVWCFCPSLVGKRGEGEAKSCKVVEVVKGMPY